MFSAQLSYGAARFNGYGAKFFTIESAHFEINYPKGYEEIAKEAGEQFEHLYTIYSKTYNVVLPTKTKVLILDAELTNGFAFSNLNFITIWTHDFDINLRGTHEWLNGVIAHEFAHIVSIWSGLKLPPSIPYIQGGYVMHPNEQNRTEIFQAVSGEILPNWFTEGIAQFEDSRNGSDSWDTHRDMILRSLTLSHKLISWEHMSVFAGRGDDFEKTYNHGFSLVRYMAETYGYDKIVTILRESSKVYHLDFNSVIKQVLGIPGPQLYKNWKHWLEANYKKQMESVGTQVYGRKINKDGYDNYWPRFSPDQKKIYFTSNGKNDYSFLFKRLYSYSLIDTVKEDKRIKPEKGIGGFYSINRKSGLITWTSMKSEKSTLPSSKGGERVYDLYLDTLPKDKPNHNPFKKKTERMLTKKASIFCATLSPTADKLALVQRHQDRFFLCLADTNGKNIKNIYPTSSAQKNQMEYIYSLDWSPDGRHIAVSYLDQNNRKIGIYDTTTKQFSYLSNSSYDDRDPRYSADGENLYFSSDRTGIFNIYRYNFTSKNIEQLTNVSGGALAPDISDNQKKLVFANYDDNGYGIYLIDSLKVLKSIPTDTSTWAIRDTIPVKPITVAFSSPHDYSRVPNQFLCIPTIIAEQLVTENANPFKGQTSVKIGAVANLIDPLGFLEMGNELGAYFLFEGSKLFRIYDFGRMNMDAGIFYTTHAMPVVMSAEFLFRGITGIDEFHDDYQSQNVTLPYQIRLYHSGLSFSHPIIEGMNIQTYGSYNLYNVLLLAEESYDQDFEYSLTKGLRGGLLWSMRAQEIDSKMEISPKGLYAKAQYDFYNEEALQDDNSFSSSGNNMSMHRFRFHQLSANVKFGMKTPFYEKSDLYFDLKGSAIKSADNKVLPSFYQPVALVPGYSYYDTTTQITKVPTDSGTTKSDSLLKKDTVVVTGKAVVSGSFSYRFPLWPRSIDKSFLFLYFDRLYGALNISGGAGFQNPSQLLDANRSDWLLSYGAEVRCEAISFNSFPMAIKLRWDRGMDRKAPVGGDHFALSIGFSFDDWDMIDVPDYRYPVRK